MLKESDCSKTTGAQVEHEMSRARRASLRFTCTLFALVTTAVLLLAYGAKAQTLSVPGIPSQFAAATSAMTQITLSWTAPTVLDGANPMISGYSMEYPALNNVPWSTLLRAGSARNSGAIGISNSTGPLQSTVVGRHVPH